MKTYEHKTAFTLIEMLIVVAVIAVLITITVSVATRLDTQSKHTLLKGTMDIIDAALAQFRDFGYRYNSDPTWGDDEREFYLSLKYPVDCNDLLPADFTAELQKTLGATSVTITSGIHDRQYTGCEVMCFFLNKIPESKKTLNNIDRSLITSEDINGHKLIMTITIGTDSTDYSLTRIMDPWGQTLRYDYYDEVITDFGNRKKTKRNFPILTSAGPDRIFGTADDIKSR